MSLATQSISIDTCFFSDCLRRLGFLHWEHLRCRVVLASDRWTSTSSTSWTSTSWTCCSRTSWTSTSRNSWSSKGKSIISDIRKTKIRPFRKDTEQVGDVGVAAGVLHCHLTTFLSQSSHWCQHGCECKYQQVPAEVQHDRVQTELRGWFDDHWPQIAILWSMRDAFDDTDTDGGDPAILKLNLLNGAF